MTLIRSSLVSCLQYFEPFKGEEIWKGKNNFLSNDAYLTDLATIRLMCYILLKRKIMQISMKWYIPHSNMPPQYYNNYKWSSESIKMSNILRWFNSYICCVAVLETKEYKENEAECFYSNTIRFLHSLQPQPQTVTLLNQRNYIVAVPIHHYAKPALIFTM